MNTNPTATREGQPAERVADVAPDLDAPDYVTLVLARHMLVGGLTPGQLRADPGFAETPLPDVMERLIAEDFDAEEYLADLHAAAEAQRVLTGRPRSDLNAELYERQLAGRAAELLPGIGLEERLELLGVMDEDDLRTSLAWLASHDPALFDAALVRDRKMVERLEERLDEQYQNDAEPYCATCGATIGIFQGHGDAWRHYRGEGTAASPVGLFDAGHEPVIAWRLAGDR